MKTFFSWGVVTLGLLMTLHSEGREKPAGRVPLFEGLGKHTRLVTKHAEAQRYFDQGLNFMFAYNHDEAVRSFQEAARLDPECAMAHWGVALASGTNYNDPSFPPERVKLALPALAEARRRAKSANPADRALIEALGHRYSDPIPEDLKPLEKAYGKAMEAVWRRFPNDADVGALYAESLMNLRPWELWTAEGKPQAETPEIVRTLEGVLKLQPDHPLALHLYIHALEASPEPGRADTAANRLRALTPGLGHLVHMPSHIDIRRGRWKEAIVANQQAIRADQAYQKRSPEQKIYRVYMAHNYHMLVFAAVMRGQSKLSLETIRAMVAEIPRAWQKDPNNAAMVDAFMCMPLEVLKRFGRWDEILKEPEQGEQFPITGAMRHYARGVALAAQGKAAEARGEQERFRTARKKVPDEAGFGNNKATEILQVADAMLEGEILLREGKVEAGLASLRKAVEHEDKLRYSEPPDWIVPVRHALGAFLLHHGKAREAEGVYREDLRRWPDNGWALYGLAASLEGQGKGPEAATIRKRFAEVWKEADIKIPSSCFCVRE